VLALLSFFRRPRVVDQHEIERAARRDRPRRARGLGVGHEPDDDVGVGAGELEIDVAAVLGHPT
jgi:hypothetical protein